jgi:hypothetical protein
MKKYILIIIAVLLVAGIGLYFGKPDLFQGRLFTPQSEKEGAYVSGKNLCLRPEIEDYTDYNETTENEKTKKTVDPGKIGIIGSGGTSTVTKDSGDASVILEPAKINRQKYEYTKNCRCGDYGKIIGQKTEKDGSVTKIRCESAGEETCRKPKFRCPEGEFLDYDAGRNICKSLKGKLCFSANPSAIEKTKKEDLEFCGHFFYGEMEKKCIPSEECEEIIGWIKSGLSQSEEMYKKYKAQGMAGTDEQIKKKAETDAGNLGSKCFGETYIP